MSPSSAAVITPARTLTYGELLNLAHQVAVDVLIAAKVQPLEPIMTSFEKSAWMAVAAYAAWYAGTAFVPVDSAVPEQRMATIATDAGISRVLTSKKLEQGRAWPSALRAKSPRSRHRRSAMASRRCRAKASAPRASAARHLRTPPASPGAPAAPAPACQRRSERRVAKRR